jgi:hypothetical protein
MYEGRGTRFNVGEVSNLADVFRIKKLKIKEL